MLCNTSSIQNKPSQLIKKVLDCSDIPEEIWNKTESIYLEVYGTSWDYDGGGFKEAFEIIVNGKVHRYSLGTLPNFRKMEWVRFYFDKGVFIRGKNKIILKKSVGTTGEYFYIGIDTGTKEDKSYASYGSVKNLDEKNIYWN